MDRLGTRGTLTLRCMYASTHAFTSHACYHIALTPSSPPPPPCSRPHWAPLCQARRTSAPFCLSHLSLYPSKLLRHHKHLWPWAQHDRMRAAQSRLQRARTPRRRRVSPLGLQICPMAHTEEKVSASHLHPCSALDIVGASEYQTCFRSVLCASFAPSTILPSAAANCDFS